MTTTRIRTVVSLVATLAITSTVAACASGAARLPSADEAPVELAARSIRFDNEARDYVHVYLVGERSEWLLGRVAPGARVTLRIPDAAVAADQESMRLAVLVGEHVTLSAGTKARAASILAQPAAEMLSQRWTFSQASGVTSRAAIGRR
jgi:hypothetical protein